MSRGRARAVARDVATSGQGPELHVDTYQAAPPSMARFQPLNPFHFDPSWTLPVPGQPGLTSCSVEAVWQGTKIHQGTTDLRMLTTPATKRPPDHERGETYDYASTRFRYGAEDVDLVSARLLIYLPTYLYLLDRLVPDSVIDEILDAVDHGRDVLCYDWDSNRDVTDPRSSFSHSAIIASWINGELDEEFVHLWRRCATARGLPTDPGLPLQRYHRRQAWTAVG